MRKSGEAKPGRRRRLVDSQTFVQYLEYEIERAARYQRSFALLLIQTPTEGNGPDREQATRDAAERTRRLTRSCDFVTSIERSGLVVTLLPETGSEGASTVFERFDGQLGKAGKGWTLKLAAYPEHAETIDYFLSRVRELLVDDQRQEWATATDRRLWQVVIPSPTDDAPPPLRRAEERRDAASN